MPSLPAPFQRVHDFTFRGSNAITTSKLPELIEIFCNVTRARGRVEKYVAELELRLRRLCQLGGMNSTRGMTATKIELAIGRVRATPLRRAAGVSPYTVANYLRAMRMFTRWLQREKLIAHDPCLNIRAAGLREDPRHPRRALTTAEVAALLTAAERGAEVWGMKGGDRRLFYEVLLTTGLRSGELRRVPIGWCYLDGDDPHILLPAKATKNRRAATVPVPRELAVRLAKNVDGKFATAPLFQMPDESNVVRMLRHDLRAAHVRYQTVKGYADVHALRHTFITRLVQVGTDLSCVKELARHSTLRMTEVYAHADDSGMLNAVDRVHQSSLQAMANAGRAA